MTVTAVIGAQFGDCGKGKIVDYLADLYDADAVVRFGGGNNAGHTVVVAGEKYKFHIYPSGGLQEDVLNIIGPGVVVNPDILIEEIENLKKSGYGINLRISDNADMIMPWHIALDGAREEERGNKKIGTTKRGIGPAYMDTAGRTSAITVGDLTDIEIFVGKVDQIYEWKKGELSLYGKKMEVTKQEIFENSVGWKERLDGYICDTVTPLNEMIDYGKEVIFEGAQGTLIDKRFGIRPYVTSSHPTIGGIAVGAGVSPKLVNNVVGVAKAYLTRVGEGPVPTELGHYEQIKGEEEPSEEKREEIAVELLDTINNGEASDIEIGRFLRIKGGEYGTTTGRPRRTGWLDIPMLNYSNTINRFDSWAITKIDVLSGLDEVKMATRYLVDEEETDVFVPKLSYMEKLNPVYETFEGWEPMDSVDWKPYIESGTLPANVGIYVKRIEELTGVPIKIISIGPGREETIAL